MAEETERGPRTRTVLLVAVFGPLLLAMVFIQVVHQVNRPTPGPMRPGEGQAISDRNNRIVRIHAVVQGLFVVLGTWLIPRRSRTRIWFLLVAAPTAAVAFELSWLSLIAG